MSKSKLALLGGKPTGGAKVPAFPHFEKSAIDKVVDILETGRTVGLGRTNPVIEEAEQAISQYHDGRQSLVVNSGHAALMCALMGLEIGPGDEVITTPYTWGASTSCILYVGAIPVFTDVDPLTGLLDPKKIEAAITPKTKAILAVHIYGQPADMPALKRIAKKHGLYLIEDGSQSHGATIHGQKVGNFGDAAGFSCMGGKILATSEAGYMVTPHEKVFWTATMMCQHYGRSAEPGFPEEYKPYVDSLVFTFRLSPLIASLFPSQVRRLPAQVEARQTNAAIFRDAMQACEVVQLPKYRKGFEPSNYIMTMNFRPQKAGVRRETFSRALAAEGVNAWPYVPESIHKWSRLQWRNYKGPIPLWLDGIKRARTNYAAQDLPNADYKVAHALEMGWTSLFRRDAQSMKRMARAFLKVQDNLSALQKWEAEEDAKRQKEESEIIGAAKRAAASYKRR